MFKKFTNLFHIIWLASWPLLSIAIADRLDACPSNFRASDLSLTRGAKRDHLLLVRLDKRHNLLEEIPIQIDPRTVLGRHQFPGNKVLNKSLLQTNDRLFFHSSFFGNKIRPSDIEKLRQKYCQYSRLIELKSTVRSAFAYLLVCRNRSRKKYAALVDLDLKKHFVESDIYYYQFNKKNHMLFDGITIKPDLNPIASNSRLIIGNDVRNFFDIVFDSDDILSRLEKSAKRPVGTAARVSFYLKLLFLKIELALKTDLSFFQDSAHIPMVAHLPIHAPDYLNPGSGILYLWQQSSQPRVIEMPRLSANHLGSSMNPAKYCHAQNCYFRIIYQSGKKEFSLNFVIKKSLVLKGFYPNWVNQPTDLKGLKWLKDGDIKKTESGVYFETSKLSKGSHRWNFWMKIGSTTQGICPEKLEFKDLGL